MKVLHFIYSSLFKTIEKVMFDERLRLSLHSQGVWFSRFHFILHSCREETKKTKLISTIRKTWNMWWLFTLSSCTGREPGRLQWRAVGGSSVLGSCTLSPAVEEKHTTGSPLKSVQKDKTNKRKKKRWNGEFKISQSNLGKCSMRIGH